MTWKTDLFFSLLVLHKSGVDWSWLYNELGGIAGPFHVSFYYTCVGCLNCNIVNMGGYYNYASVILALFYISVSL